MRQKILKMNEKRRGMSRNESWEENTRKGRKIRENYEKKTWKENEKEMRRKIIKVNKEGRGASKNES